MNKDKKLLLIFVYGPFVLVVGAILLLAFNFRAILDAQPPEFSKKNMLQALWHHYKEDYLEPETTRSLDKQQDNITTSEGQSYTMLRAVWMDDKETFDSAWQWTKDNLQRDEDHLISWLFGERSDGSYGILTERGGYNSASDADVDIALALLFASKRWNDEQYFGDALELMRDIWDKEVVMIAGKPYLAANNLEKAVSKSSIIINPSYLAPYAYKIFHQVDSDRDWLGLAATSYEIAQKSMVEHLDKSTSAYLPPDWVQIDKTSGSLSAVPASTNLTTNFSYDSLRLPWRFAVDYAWNKDPRAKAVLDGIGTLASEWNEKRSIAVSYSHDGARLIDKESPAMYGGVLGYFIETSPRAADDIYFSKLEALYDTNESKWRYPQGYYDDNWAWFGMALYAGEVRDLYTPDDVAKTDL